MGLAALPGSGTRLHGIPPVSLFSMQGAISATPVFAESVFAYPASPLSIRRVPSGAPQAASDPDGRFSAEAISIRAPPLAAGLVGGHAVDSQAQALAVAADSLHSSGQEGSNNSDAKAAAKGSHMPTAADMPGKPKRARARKAAPAIPLAVKTRNQIAQDEHLRRMQLRSG